MKLILDFIPEKVSTNKIYAGVHWKKRKEIKDLYEQALVYGLKREGDDLETFPVDIHIDFYFASRALDSSNCSYMAKMCEDVLVSLKILPDDSIKYVRRFSMQSHKAKEDRIEIEIKEV